MNIMTSTPSSTQAMRSVLVQLCNQTNIQILSHLRTAPYFGLNSSISRALGISTQLTSKRLKKLVDVDLINIERIGKLKLYSLNLDRFNQLGLQIELLLQELL